jgi:hypothetical protein
MATGSPLPVDVARQIDLLCDEYERQRRQGAPPDLDSFLGQVPAAARDIVREELAAVEAECRWQSGAAVPVEELARRFQVPA